MTVYQKQYAFSVLACVASVSVRFRRKERESKTARKVAQVKKRGGGIACVASVSVRFRRKELGTRVKDREKSGASKKGGRGRGTSPSPPPLSLFGSRFISRVVFLGISLLRNQTETLLRRRFQFRKTPLLIVYYSILYKEASVIFTN